MRHAFVNSDPTKFDSNCSVCDGKQRDSVHAEEPSEPSLEGMIRGVCENAAPALWVLTVREKYFLWAGRGPRVTIHKSEAEAQAALVAYVEQNWDLEMDGDPRPDDTDEMVQLYFEHVQEAYEITRALS